MKNIIKKVLPTFIYIVAVTGIVAALMWYGANYDYAYDAELGGGAPLSERFPPPAPPEPIRPQITSLDADGDAEGEEGSDSKAPDNPGGNDMSDNPGNLGDTDLPKNPDDPQSTDPPDNPDPPKNPDGPGPSDPPEPEGTDWHAHILDKTEYLEANKLCAAEFDLEAGAVRFYALDSLGITAVSLVCTLRPSLGTELSADGESITGILLSVPDRGVLVVRSQELCDFLGYSHPIYGGDAMTLYTLDG